MTREEYNELMRFCAYKIEEGKKKYYYASNQFASWEEAFNSMRSKLSSEFKPEESRK